MNKKFTFILYLSLIFSPLNFLWGQYTWVGSDGGLWTTSTNWSPARTTPAVTDTLLFLNTGNLTVNSVPTESIAKLRISGNSNLILTSNGTNTLTILDGPGSDTLDLIVEDGASLTLGGANPLTVVLNNSATAKILPAATFTINAVCTFNTNGIGVKTVMEGTVINNGGDLICTDINKLTFGGGSKYIIKTSGTLPTARWNASSKIFFESGTSTPISVEVSTQTISQLQVTSPTQITLTSGSPATITVAGYDAGGDDFVIQSGAQLTVDNNVTVTLLDGSSFDPAVAADITGTLRINNGGTYNTSGSVQTRIIGAIINGGTLNSGAADDLSFQNNGRLLITATGKSLPKATWVANTSLELMAGGSMTFDFGSASPLTIGRLLVSNDTDVEITSSAALTLNISNGSGTDFDIPVNSSLAIGGSQPFSIVLASSGTNVNIVGNMTINSGNSFGAGASNTINGTLTNNGTYDFTATSAVTTINGTFINNNTISNSSPARCIVSSGAIYRHNRDGGNIPLATWNTNSTLEITGVTNNTPADLNQTFGKFVWATDQESDIILNTTFSTRDFTINQTGDQSLVLSEAANNTLTVNGNFTLSSDSANDKFILVNGSGNGTLSVTGSFIKSGSSIFNLKNGDGDAALSVTGNFTISGGSFNQWSAGSSGSCTVTVSGNFDLTNGSYDMSGTSGNSTLNVAGNFSNNTETITETGTGSGTIVFNGSNQEFTPGTITNTINYIINGSSIVNLNGELPVGTNASLTVNGRLNFGTNLVTGAGSFVLNSVGAIEIGDPDGITLSPAAAGNVQVTGTRTFDTGANYIYNGTATQDIGDGFPDNLTGSLEINNSSGVTLDNARTIDNTGTLNLTNGTFNIGSNLSMASVSTITRSGGELNGTLQGSGEHDITYTGLSKTTGDELSGAGLRNITINLTSGENLTLTEDLNMDGGILTFQSGKMLTDTNTVDLGTTGTITGEDDGRYIVGNLVVERTVGTIEESFGGIGVTIHAIDSAFGNFGSTTITRISGPDAIVTDDYENESIARKWIIDVTNQPTSFGNVTLNWVEDDDNGNTDDSMFVAIYSATGESPWKETGHLFHGAGTITIRINSFSTYSVIAKERKWYTFDFDNGTPGTFSTAGTSETFLPDAEPNGGNSLVTINQTGNGSWVLENSGSFGSGISLKGIAPSGSLNNKFSITNYNSSQFATLRFDVMFDSGGAGEWYLWAGNGLTSFTGTTFPTHNNNDLFLGLHWLLTSDGKISFRHRESFGWSAAEDTTFEQGIVYTVDLYFNNHNVESAPFYFGLPPEDLNPSSWDLFVNGERISPVNGYERIGNSINSRQSLNSFSFIGTGSPANTAIIHLDKIFYSNYLDAKNPPLPVELSSFTGKFTGVAVQLNWRTETEVNNYGFELEKLSPGQKDWKKIGFVQGHGNSNSPKEYSFTDKDVKYGMYSYRLKQIDSDGKFEYSEIVQVNLGLPEEITLFPNYPNPFNPKTTISFTLPEEMNVTLKVFNILGQEVKTLIDGRKGAGIYSIEFDGSDLTSGFYIYRIEAGDFVQVKKMLLLK